MPSQEPDYFTLLGVSPEASEQEIRQAFRLRAAIVRPDRFDPELNPAEFRKANEMLRELNEAYKALKDRARRAAHSAQQETGRTSQSRSGAARQDRQRSSERQASAKTSGSTGARTRSATRSQPAETPAPLSAGWTNFASITAAAQQFLLERQRNPRPSEFRYPTGSPFWNYVCIVSALAWFWYLFAQTGGERWSVFAWLWFFTGTVAALWLAAFNVAEAARWHSSRLKWYFYLTPLYFIMTEYDRIRFWPIWDLRDLNVKHNTKDGKYQNSEVTMVFDDSQATVTLLSLESLEELGRVYTSLSEKAAKAIADGDRSYFADHDLFGNCQREHGTRTSDRMWLYSGAGALAAAFPVFWLADAANRHYAANPPRHEYPPVVAQELPTVTKPGTTVAPDMPERILSIDEFERLMQEDFLSPDNRQREQAPREPFPHREQPLPANGSVDRFHVTEAVAPLRIVTRDTQHYFVKLSRWEDDSREILTMFVRAGQSAETTVPLGLYRIKYATGATWYGPNRLFGWATRYFRADTALAFRQTGNKVSGYTVELYLQEDGNLQTEPIPREEW